MPFGELTGVHFARVFVLDGGVAADGSDQRQKLVWMSDVDAPLERHLGELSELAGPRWTGCSATATGYPDARDAGARRAFLDAHAVPAATAYVNTVGRGLDQVLLERRLREAIEGHLDAHPELAQRPRQRRRPRGDPRLRGGDEALSPRADSRPSRRRPGSARARSCTWCWCRCCWWCCCR